MKSIIEFGSTMGSDDAYSDEILHTKAAYLAADFELRYCKVALLFAIFYSHITAIHLYNSKFVSIILQISAGASCDT